MNAAESGPPKPALAVLAIRAMPKSVALIQRRASQRSHSQCAEPMWSGCMWVTMTRSTGRPSSSLAKICSQAARVPALSMPQSTMLQPSRAGAPPSAGERVAQQPDVDVVERERQRHARHLMPGATSKVRPGSGTSVPRQ